MQKLILIDLSQLLFRSFFSHKELCTSKGIGTGMCYGAIQTLLYLCTKYGWVSSQIILIGDGKPRWKFELFPGYKAKRKKHDLPPAMSVPIQFKISKLILTFLGMGYCEHPGEECDDTLAAFINKAKISFPGRFEFIILGSDHDYYQLLSEDVSMLMCDQNGEQQYTEAVFQAKYHIFAEDYWKVLTLGGCGTDKVPGMRQIGEKTAAEIVCMNRWEQITNNDPSLKFPRKSSQTAFRKYYKDWKRERDEKLVRLNRDITFRYHKHQFNEAKLREWFVYAEFNHFLKADQFPRICEIFSRSYNG